MTLNIIFNKMSNTDTLSYRIYPSIGIARMGNGPAKKEEVIFSPEVPWRNIFETDIEPYTSEGALKKQAQRFYIYQCDEQGNPLRKISPDDYDIEWFVEVANKKPFWYDFNNSLDLSVSMDGNNKNLSEKFFNDRIAPGISASSRNPNIPSEGVDESGIPNSRKELVNGPNFGSVSLANKTMEVEGLFPFPRVGEVSNLANKLRTVPKSVKLGSIEYDAESGDSDTNGSLIFYSADGVSASLNPSDLNTDFADNSNWYDDICDGRVTAKLTPKNGGDAIHLNSAESSAWIATAPPDYAPQINPISSLYDLVNGADPADVLTDDDSCLSMVLPLFFKFYQMQWVNLGDFLAPSFKETIDKLTYNGNFSYLFTSGEESRATREAIFTLFRNPRYDYINEPIIPSADVTSFEALGIPSVPQLLPYYVGDGVNYPGSPAQWFAIPPLLYDKLERWSKGEFNAPASLESADPKNMIELGEFYQQSFLTAAEDPKKAPLLMTRAVLETLYGGGFHPGVELTWPMRHAQIYSENRLTYDSVNGEEEYDLFGLREVRINSATAEVQKNIFFNDFGFLMTSEDVKNSMDPENAESWLWQITPGDLTKWMGIPWQSDAGSCQAVWTKSQYPVPTWWAANLPIDVLTNETFEAIQNSETLPDTKRNLYATRQPWLQTTDTGYVGYHAEGGYANGLINMVYQWDQIGSVAARSLDLEGYPKTVYVSFHGNDVAQNQPILLGVEYANEIADSHDVFYTRTLRDVLIPSGKIAILAAEPDGTGATYVDDQVTILVNGVEVYQHDYSNGNSGGIIPMDPVDLTDSLADYVGQKVEVSITYTNVYGESRGASSFFLFFR